MKGEEKIPWVEMIALLLMLIIGMLLPFWMEWKSRTNPLPGRVSRAGGLPTLEDRRAHYCPACGAKLLIPAWQTEPLKKEFMPPLSLRTLKQSASELPSHDAGYLKLKEYNTDAD